MTCSGKRTKNPWWRSHGRGAAEDAAGGIKCLETDPVVAATERELVIPNKEGLHFRPIMKFVDTAQRFQAGVTVHCDDRQADGR